MTMHYFVVIDIRDTNPQLFILAWNAYNEHEKRHESNHM